jgi:dihydrofolate reductase
MQARGDPNEYASGGWQRPYVCKEQLDLIGKQAVEVDALLLGRNTYESFAAAWPGMTEVHGLAELADRMNSMPKFVASTTLTELGWNATLIKGDLATAVAELKQQPGGGLLVAGSQNLLRFLAQHDLVDEYRTWVHPVIVGEGERMFDDAFNTSKWSLAPVQTTPTGQAILTYTKAQH